MVCDSFILDKESSTEFKLTGHVQFKDLKQRAAVCNKAGYTAHVPFKVVNMSVIYILFCRILPFLNDIPERVPRSNLKVL